MKRRQFLIAGSGSLLFGWLSALLPQGAMAAAPAHRYRHTDQEISIFQPESATWQASLRLQSHLRVGDVWQQGHLLCARIHLGSHSFVLTSADGRTWQSS
ncbi:MAG: hypothetical protein KJZ86_22620 [Caldilineaceae bacterium]|nr:hypothetical protein [Caldilineaceae bacterium]